MLERYATFEATCDFCSGECEDTRETDFMAAVAWLKDRGWKIFKKDGEWHHKGPDCASEDRDVNFDAA
jgi:hypothetical protein